MRLSCLAKDLLDERPSGYLGTDPGPRARPSPTREGSTPLGVCTTWRESRLCLSAHAFAECYALLTALPVSPQVTPGQAHRLVQENVADAAEEIVELEAMDYLTVLQRMTDLGLESGAVYDALHVHCAEKASVEELRTFNGEDFRRMPPEPPTELVVL